MNLKRICKHLLLPPWTMRRTFSAAALQRIEDAVAASERSHRGELCVVIEHTLDLMPLLRGQTPRERARDVFARRGVWDTAENSGVLLYINWADRDIEIVADRGISASVDNGIWEDICRHIEIAFRAGRFEAGVLEGIGQITQQLICHFPVTGTNPDELGNRPAML